MVNAISANMAAELPRNRVIRTEVRTGRGTEIASLAQACKAGRFTQALTKVISQVPGSKIGLMLSQNTVIIFFQCWTNDYPLETGSSHL